MKNDLYVVTSLENVLAILWSYKKQVTKQYPFKDMH